MSFSPLSQTKREAKKLPKSYIKFWKPIVKGGAMVPACPDKKDRFHNRQFYILDLDTPGFTPSRVTAMRRDGFKAVEVVVGKYDKLDDRNGIYADVAAGLEAEIEANKEEHSKSAEDWKKNREILEQDEEARKAKYAGSVKAIEANIEVAKARGETPQTLAENAGVGGSTEGSAGEGEGS